VKAAVAWFFRQYDGQAFEERHDPAMTQALYPIRFKEILRNYSFGARKIPRVFAKQGLPENHTLAETWEVCDRPKESSTVMNGPLSGKTLHELIDLYGSDLLGQGITQKFGKRFPLLIKFLDASNPLGEQVHQSDELAREQGLDDPGKTEAWYMVHADPGTTVECGSINGLTREIITENILANTIRTCMKKYSVAPGDAFLLYAGTMHYSNGGVLFYEIMQNSDVIIGLHSPRETDSAKQRQKAVEAARGVRLENDSDFRIPPVAIRQGTNVKKIVLACRHFAVERLELREPYMFLLPDERFYTLSLIAGQVRVKYNNYEEHLMPGNSILLPASLEPVVLYPEPAAVVLSGYVPDLVKNIIVPCRQAGIADEDILALGGKTELNDLRQHLASTPYALPANKQKMEKAA
jgi:mannose-6-phosphate isomerase